MKASFSGFADVIPALLIWVKIGDSFILKSDIKRDGDQDDREQEGNSPAPIREVLFGHGRLRAEHTSSETKSPSVAVIWMKLV